MRITKQSARTGNSGAPLRTTILDCFRGMLTLLPELYRLATDGDRIAKASAFLPNSVSLRLYMEFQTPCSSILTSFQVVVDISLRHPESRDLSSIGTSINTTPSECRLRGFLSNFMQLSLETLKSTWAFRAELLSVRDSISQQVDLAPYEFASKLRLSTSIQ